MTINPDDLHDGHVDEDDGPYQPRHATKVRNWDHIEIKYGAYVNAQRGKHRRCNA